MAGCQKELADRWLATPSKYGQTCSVVNSEVIFQVFRVQKVKNTFGIDKVRRLMFGAFLKLVGYQQIPKEYFHRGSEIMKQVAKRAEKNT